MSWWWWTPNPFWLDRVIQSILAKYSIFIVDMNEYIINNRQDSILRKSHTYLHGSFTLSH
ncbi:hypothetical protein DERP_010687 [Dermatophagoides pteronyssinus]|uniref:Uncharacterized protein n=1 Tax=Dermatophagoides pteronyssinus TaxID=6956 RepID=A0ABQ8JAL4_DERPT|nr:hypothetical protein DERP_010687 [Dermatophagoides pteronyssinus]